MQPAERRDRERSHFDFLKDLLYKGLRLIARQAGSFYQAFGIFLVAGLGIALLGTWAFAAWAGHVQSGATQAFDESALRWIGAHRMPLLDASLLEITALGTGLVVMTIVAVASLFLVLSGHKYSAFLLLFATAGGIVLNNLLKFGFDRPRPKVIEWGTHAMSSSFPSGHAMSATIVYSTVALLAMRLEKHRWQRVLTALVAALIIVLICASRLYLGVHYPSDVLGGSVIGLAWTGFCMAGLEAVKVFAKRYKPRELQKERDLVPRERRAAGLEP